MSGKQKAPCGDAAAVTIQKRESRKAEHELWEEITTPLHSVKRLTIEERKEFVFLFFRDKSQSISIF